MERIKEHVMKIVERLLESERVHILAHADADGITSAAILGKALMNSDIQFDIRPLITIETSLFAQAYEDRKDVGGTRVLLDLGSNLSAISGIFPDAIVIDHHQITGTGNVLLFNPRKKGLSTPTAVLTYFVAKHIDPGAYRYSYLPLVGAWGDNALREDASDPLVKSVLREAEFKGIIRSELGRRVYDDSRPLAEILSSIVPEDSKYYRNPREVAKFLKDMNIKTDSLSELTEKEKMLIQDHLNIKLERIYYIVGETLPMLKTVHEFSTLINACCKMGHPEEGLSVALGDRDEGYVRAINIYKEYRRELGSHIAAARSKRFTYRNTIDVVILDDVDRKKASTIASVLRKNKGKRPLIVVGYNGDKIKISARGRGNLGYVIQRAAALVGGEGGGHENAAGATIPKDKLTDFLDTVVGLIKKSRAAI